MGASAARVNPEIQALTEACCNSTKVTAKVLFPERFVADFSPLHDEIFSRIDNPRLSKVGIAAPRGIGKTSIVGLALAARKILFRQIRFLVYVSNSLTVAEMQTENLKRELVSNRDVRRIFGDIRTSAADGIDESFSKKSWVANGHTLILPRGSNQQVRGLLHGNYRPDLIIVDDLEDTETIDNEEIRKSRKTWFLDDLMKSTSRVDKNWKVVYIDTIKHQASLLSELLEWHDWDCVRLEMCNDELQSNVPSFMSNEEIRKEYDEHAANGNLDGFYREFRNIVIARETASYKQEYFKYYEEADKNLNLDRNVTSVVIVDPAKTTNLHSAESGIIGWGIDTRSNLLYLRDAVGAKLHPDQLYDTIFAMALKLRARVIAVEVTSLEDFIMQPLVNEMIRRGHNFQIVPLKAEGKKEYRDAALISYYRNGLVLHNKAISGPLEAQMLSYPKNARWDLLDAANYVVKLMEEGEVYFEPPEGDDNYEDEYKQLLEEDDEPLVGWMVG